MALVLIEPDVASVLFQSYYKPMEYLQRRSLQSHASLSTPI